MSDYSEHGAIPVEDAVIDDPPTVDEVIERQRKEYPEQAASSTMEHPLTAEERAALAAGGEPLEPESGGVVDIAGPNSA